MPNDLPELDPRIERLLEDYERALEDHARLIERNASRWAKYNGRGTATLWRNRRLAELKQDAYRRLGKKSPTDKELSTEAEASQEWQAYLQEQEFESTEYKLGEARIHISAKKLQLIWLKLRLLGNTMSFDGVSQLDEAEGNDAE